MITVMSLGSLSFAEEITALIASVDGSAQILDRKPFKAQNDEQKNLTYEGTRYYFSKAKIGAKINSGQGVMTASDGKVKIIYKHGDVVIVGPSSSLFVPISDGKTMAKNEINLLYGKLRAVIDREGPLSGLKIKTPSAVAGVRGTDLYVSYNQADQNTEVQVLRGEVEVEPTPAQNSDSKETPAKSLDVKSGEKAEIELDHAAKTTLSTEAPAPLKSSVEKSTKNDMVRIQESSSLVSKTDEAPLQVKPEVAQAEKVAIANIIKDIKRYDPETSASIENKKYASVDLVNTASMQKVEAAAVDNKSVAEEVVPPRYVFDGASTGFSLAGVSSTFNCANMGGGICSPTGGAGGQIGFVRRYHRTERFILQYGAFIDDRNVSFSQNYGYGYTNTTNANQFYVGGGLLATYNFGTKFAVEGGANLEFTGASMSWVNSNFGFNNSNGVSSVFNPFEFGIRYSFTQKFDAELLYEANFGIIGDTSIAGYKASSFIFRASYFVF